MTLSTTRHEKNIEVVALGEAMVEFNQTAPDQPQYLQGFGGDTSNATIAAARAGVRTAYLTRLGDDLFAQQLRQLWHAEGVNTDGIEVDAHAPTGIYFVTHGPDGHAFSYRRADSAASKMNVNWLSGAPAALIGRAKWLHVSGISLAISEQACNTVFAALDIARRTRTFVSFDSNLRLKLWSIERARIHIANTVSRCDLFLPSIEDMTALTGLTDPEAITRWSHDQGASRVVLKLGAQGALVSEQRLPDGSKAGQPQYDSVWIPGRSVNPVDATGAGDCFCGNILARLSLGDDLVTAAHYANTAASLAVQNWGAVACLPTTKEVQAVL
ncbi:MAG: sugar kinase [Zwartia sp.]